MTATETRPRATPHPRPERQDPPKTKLPFRSKLTRWDHKYSPYVYIAPFFILFAIIGLFPMHLHGGDLVSGMGPGP